MLPSSEGLDALAGPLWKRAGIDAFLSKPVNVSELLERLKALNKSRSQLDTRQQSLPLKKAEVLLSGRLNHSISKRVKQENKLCDLHMLVFVLTHGSRPHQKHMLWAELWDLTKLAT